MELSAISWSWQLYNICLNEILVSVEMILAWPYHIDWYLVCDICTLIHVVVPLNRVWILEVFTLSINTEWVFSTEETDCKQTCTLDILISKLIMIVLAMRLTFALHTDKGLSFCKWTTTLKLKHTQVMCGDIWFETNM